ncbi:bifunctional 2',3'-cyclic-nucleotide 2'-phosphodiesterase/3'-nucleotidase [Rhodovulum sp. P5]|uniref:bifunctional 2',3'-cyclic-nucleotide 2'-phosphodiesterase/3'-nucleotidase n=1 Tax=Rhodovulum sp. P5 TaxID=1564506 RepID=UPI0021121310|nr:bifunctional 2',3'-cyclic-nucleotide 2'-phosphodiesterase/3'-nucleotidase [Rhodovulum sp. P5]
MVSLHAQHPFSSKAGAGQAHLRLMATTDLHTHVYPYDYFADKPADTVGLARLATHIASIRAGAVNTMLVDDGDFLQGNPMGDYVAFERGVDKDNPHPIIRAMNQIGFDASTLGNHEFNYGLDFVLRSVAGAAFPILSANLVRTLGDTPLQDETVLPPYVILDRELIDGDGKGHPFRVGLIGFLPPQVMTWDRKNLEGRVCTRDIVEAAAAYVPRMRAEGADLVIALNHSGIGETDHVDGQENASLPLAAIEGVDIVLAGHQHMLFPGPVFDGIPGVDSARGTLNGKPAVMGGFWGSHLGVIDLLLERTDQGWTISDHESSLCPIARRNPDHTVTAVVKSDQRVLDAVAEDHAGTLSYIRRAVGRTKGPLHSYFALVADNPALQLVANAQLWYMRDMLKGSAYETLPVLSAAAPFKAGGLPGPDYFTDIPPGDLAIKHVADLYLYPNTIRAVRVTGAELKGWLERAAGIFNRIEPGAKDQPLIDLAFPSYNFDVIDGVDYQIDASQPSRFCPKGRLVNPGASRIRNLCYMGEPVHDEMEFIVATNNFRAGGGGGFPGASGNTIVFEGPDTNRDVIVRYIAEQGTVDPAADYNWRLAPLPGTSVLFETAPRASAFLGDLVQFDIRTLGQAANGFAQFRISF